MNQNGTCVRVQYINVLLQFCGKMYFYAQVHAKDPEISKFCVNG